MPGKKLLHSHQPRRPLNIGRAGAIADSFKQLAGKASREFEK
jgi:hypothetical protein